MASMRMLTVQEQGLQKPKRIWHETLETIKVFVSSAIFKTWFLQTYLHDLRKTENNRYIAEVGCSSHFIKLTLESRYFGLTQDALSKSLGSPCDIIFLVRQKDVGKLQDSTPLFSENKKDLELTEYLVKANLRPGFNFENFAVSSSNQMAWAAAEAVSKNPGTAYNPLFIWGGVGVGKTHLMIAIGHEIVSKNPGAKVLLSTGEGFTNGIVEGIRNKTTPNFRDKYRKLSCLMLDDIQFIAGKDTAQEEFFHTFNAISAAGGQIIMTSDKHPTEMPKLEDRLRSRFEAGLIVDIANPDFELRCAIAQIKAKQKGLELSNPTVQLIAGNLDSARKIEGFLVKLATEARVKKVEIDQDLVESLIGKKNTDLEKKIKAITPEQMINATCQYFSVGKRGIMGAARQQFITRPRQILMYLLRTELGLSFEEVGRLVGGRDHTTVMHGVNKISKETSTEVKTRGDILGIKNSL